MVRVSVVIPSYNREGLIAATLDSVRAQTYPHWEAIVVDDRSDDASADVVRRYAADDARIRLVLREGGRRGANVCRNQGLRLARGPFVVFLDSDDLLAPGCLERRVAELDASAGCALGIYQTETFTRRPGDGGQPWNTLAGDNDLGRFLSLDTVWLTTSPIWIKAEVERLGGFDEEVLSLQDWAIHVRALIAGLNYYKVDVRDNFHRYQYDPAHTVSGGTRSRAHLPSHERLFVDVLERLKSAGRADAANLERMGGLFWWLARLWLAAGDRPAAARVWRRSFDLGLCDRRRLLEGWLVLRLHGLRGGKRLVGPVQRSWPAGLLAASESWGA